MADTTTQTYEVDPTSTTRTPLYHTDEQAAYLLPNDTPEQRRLALQAAHISRLLQHRVHHAPLDPARTNLTLDIGCGTGSVTNALGLAFPSAQHYGLDLSPVPDPHHPARPPNVHFLRGNIATQHPPAWTPALPARTRFDYAFSRLLVLGITDWPGLFAREFALLNPGAWAEVQELDSGTYFSPAGAPVSDAWEWHRAVAAGCAGMGLDLHAGTAAAGRMRAAGFVDVRVFRHRWWFGGEAAETPEGERGFARFLDASFPELLHHVVQRMLEGGEGWSQEGIDGVRAEMKRCFDPKVAMYVPFTVTIGRKPE